MKSRVIIGVCIAAIGLQTSHAANVKGGDEAAPPLSQEEAVAALQAGNLDDLRLHGLLLFSSPFTRADGLGDGPFDPSEVNSLVPGHRPTLQGSGMMLRINGLDAQSCNECHTIVSNRTIPPTLGIGGVGGVVQNALIMPTVLDVADSSDHRVQYASGHDPDLSMAPDGVADFNGRFANPPFLFGGGGVELLAKEMTTDLQALLRKARGAPPGTRISLDTHGVNFGQVTSLGGGQVEVEAEGVDSDLVVRPFGRKGENFSMRDFDRVATQFHFGIQPVEVVGDADEDGDGVAQEITVGEMTALHVFDVTNPPPAAGRLTGRAKMGARVFARTGCMECHRPRLQTRSRFLPLAFPEVPQAPDANVYVLIDLAKVGFQRVPGGKGVYVPLFADLKRHRMGPGLAETFEHPKIANDEFTTARLWGIADTSPYLHDGRATTLAEAIGLHGG